MLSRNLSKSDLFTTCHHYFIIEPRSLFINNQSSLISPEAMIILKKKKIQLSLAYYDFNEHDIEKQIIFFIHGNSFSKEVFIEQIKYFSKNYRVIAIDLLGHGKSTNFSKLNLSQSDKEILAESFYNPCSMIAEILYFLKAKNIKNLHGIGWSLGGHLLYGIASEDDKLISSITSIGSPPVQFSYQGLKKGFNEWFIDTLLPEWINNPKFYENDDSLFITKHVGFRKEDYYVSKQIIKSDPLMRKHLFLKLNEYDLEKFNGSCLDGEHFVSETHLPVLMLVGENDVGVNVNYFNQFNHKFHHNLSEVKVIKGAPHAIFSTHYSEYMNTIINFIDRV